VIDANGLDLAKEPKNCISRDFSKHLSLGKNRESVNYSLQKITL
jgi:hypothetical protein